MTKQNIIFNRARFEKVLKWCDAHGVVAQISKIRTGVMLKDGSGSYEFNIRDVGANIYGHVGLDRNDLFIPFGLGMFPVLDTPTRSGKKALMSYPQLASEASDGFMTEDFEAFYNGSVLIRIDQDQVNESLPCELFKHVPQTQPAISKDADGNSYSIGVVPQFDLENAMVPLVPAYMFQGTSKIKIECQFNGVDSNFGVALKAAPSTKSTDYNAFLDLVMVGVLVKGAADSSKINPLEVNKLTYGL